MAGLICQYHASDVFDALVSKRPYKEAFSDHMAYDIITKDSGSHFDPDVVSIVSTSSGV